MNGFFRNRYGFDRLNLVLIAVSMLFLFLPRYFWSIAFITLGFAVFRAMSRNFSKRQRELIRFESVFGKVSNWLDKMFRPVMRRVNKAKFKRENKKIYKYIKCRYCKKKLRVPRNKGKIKVTCPDCKNQFIIKT